MEQSIHLGCRRPDGTELLTELLILFGDDVPDAIRLGLGSNTSPKLGQSQ